MNEFEISALVVKGYLPEEARSDPKAIKAAIEALVSDLAFELEQQAFIESGSRSWNLRKNWKLDVVKKQSPESVGPNFAMHWNGHTREQVTLDGEMTWNMP
jgi:hypothetical protein